MLVPYLGANLQPLARNASPPSRRRSPLLSHATPSLQLFSDGSWVALDHVYWVQSTQQGTGDAASPHPANYVPYL